MVSETKTIDGTKTFISDIKGEISFTKLHGWRHVLSRSTPQTSSEHSMGNSVSLALLYCNIDVTVLMELKVIIGPAKYAAYYVASPHFSSRFHEKF